MSDGVPADVAAEVERQHALIMRGTAYGDEGTRRVMDRELRSRLTESLIEDRPLRVYLGVDPTSPDLHIGHCVTLRKLALFQHLGHQSILLIGDFTGLVGDPSDKDSLRPMQAAEILNRNAETYRDQAFKLLDPVTTEVRRNSEWLGEMSFGDVIHLASNFTVQQFAERDTFSNRIDAGQPVYLHEFMYGLMQGYDAVALEADIQLGGTDQTFNIMCGRTLQERQEQSAQVAVLTPILVGTDGTLRMSKSTGNYIGIDEPPNTQYGKAMSIPDDVIVRFFDYGTNIPDDEVDQIEADLNSGTFKPMDAKRRLARSIVAEWHGDDAAQAAEEQWTRTFSQRTVPDDIPEAPIEFAGADTVEVALPVLLHDIGAAASRAEAKRLVSQGAVRIDDEVVKEQSAYISNGAILRVGRRKWYRIVGN
ncbi:MAG: tyrosine--tRNA ligase [Chloroflexi bacterium]|nr:tyrosine--tRNA ligase [Chloroflexota bacterium]MCY3589286.1 tyrosine--tRNA ligase [Chloroflexota bacterium]MCY3686395.1 tyrosine--tRNA ligase [Chloroflexota bacterium]MDE2708119.1 tyrosine--tRNA ligase [Chloroflexota bacterium]